MSHATLKHLLNFLKNYLRLARTKSPISQDSNMVQPKFFFLWKLTKFPFFWHKSKINSRNLVNIYLLEKKFFTKVKKDYDRCFFIFYGIFAAVVVSTFLKLSYFSRKFARVAPRQCNKKLILQVRSIAAQWSKSFRPYY